MPFLKTFKPNPNLPVVYDADSLAALVKESVDYYEKNYRKAKERAKRTHEEVKAQVLNEYEEENKQLKKNNDLVWLRFSSYKEKEAYENFTWAHRACRREKKVNGGKMPYLIPTHTGFGTALTAVCPICGEKEDITDLECW